MKKTISILLSVIMLISIVSATNINANASSSYRYSYYDGNKYGIGDGFIFKIDTYNKTATVVRCLLTTSTVTVPDKLDQYTVVSISEDYHDLFGYKYTIFFDERIKILNIPSTIKSIDSIDGGVHINENLQAINVENGNAYFSSKDGVLYNSNKTTLIYYPPKKTSKTFTIPNSVAAIKDFAISNDYMTKLVIPNSVKKVDNLSDYKCIVSGGKKLKTIKFGNGIKNLVYYTVVNCPNLTNVIIPKGVKVESDETFFNCNKLPSYVLSKYLKLKKGKNYIKISWKKPKVNYGGSNYGYEIQYATNKKFKNKKILRLYSSNTTSAKITNIKGNKKYYFKIRKFYIYEDVPVKFDFKNFSKTISITTPKKCKTYKDLTKKQAEKIAINKTIKDFKLKGTSKKYLYCNTTKINFYGRKYYAIDVNANPVYEGGHRTNINSQLIAVDGSERLYGKYGYSSDDKKNCVLWIKTK